MGLFDQTNTNVMIIQDNDNSALQSIHNYGRVIERGREGYVMLCDVES